MYAYFICREILVEGKWVNVDMEHNLVEKFMPITPSSRRNICILSSNHGIGENGKTVVDKLELIL